MPYFATLGLLLRPILFILTLLSLGTSGYMTLENWSFVDSFYMTVITVSTVGFSEVNPLDDSGKIFTVFVIFGGVIFYGISFHVMVQLFLENRFKEVYKREKMQKKIEKLKNHFVIAGGGRMAYSIAIEMERAKQPFVIIDSNKESVCALAIKNQKKPNWLLLNGDALLESTLREAKVTKASGLAVVLPTDSDNLFVVLSARSLNPKLKIDTRISNENNRIKMMQAGADKVLSPYTVGGMQMARSLVNPEVDSMLEVVMDQVNLDFDMQIHKVTKEDSFYNKSIQDSNIRNEGFIVIGIRKDGKHFEFAPTANTLLNENCEIFMLGSARARNLHV